MLKTSTFCFLSLLKGRCQSLLLYHPYYLLNANRGTSCWIKMCNCSKSPGRALAMTNRDEKVQLCLRRAINNSYFSPPAHRIFRCIDRHMARLQSTSEELIAEIQSWKTKENWALVPVIYATSKKKPLSSTVTCTHRFTAMLSFPSWKTSYISYSHRQGWSGSLNEFPSETFTLHMKTRYKSSTKLQLPRFSSGLHQPSPSGTVWRELLDPFIWIIMLLLKNDGLMNAANKWTMIGQGGNGLKLRQGGLG